MNEVISTAFASWGTCKGGGQHSFTKIVGRSSDLNWKGVSNADLRRPGVKPGEKGDHCRIPCAKCGELFPGGPEKITITTEIVSTGN